MAGDPPRTRIGQGNLSLRWWCFVLTAAALVASGTSAQLYDAILYTDTPQALLDGRPMPDGYALRGALTWVVYLPAALGTLLGVPMNIGVLLQNSALLAAVGAFLLPSFVDDERRAGARWAAPVCCVVVVVVLGRFAPIGLMDIWAASALLLAVWLIKDVSGLRVLFAGAMLGAAVNLRPAYLLPALFVLVGWLIWVRKGWLLLALGTCMAVLPQGVVEFFRPGSFAAWWENTKAINELQLSYASWVVRYDTVPVGSSDPRQFFCHPEMAASQQSVIDSPVKLAGHLLTNLPASFDFAIQKMSAWFLWTWTTPYFDLAEPEVSQLSVLVVAIAVMGIVGWAHAARSRRVSRPVVVVVAAAVLAIMLGAVTSTPEARFALPLVLLGIAGCLRLTGNSLRPRHLAVAVALMAILLFMGHRGLAHPAPPGGVTPDVCATAASS